VRAVIDYSRQTHGLTFAKSPAPTPVYAGAAAEAIEDLEDDAEAN